MAYDQILVQKIEQALHGKRGISTRNMFGGICFMLNGNMLCGITGDKLVARVGPDAYEKFLKYKQVTPMDFTGKPLASMVYVLPQGLRRTKDVQTWIDRCLNYVATLPPKKKK